MDESGRVSSKSVLVTGASGFIGHELCVRLRSHGVRVRAMTRQGNNGPWDDSFCADLASGSLPPKLLERVDTVFHLAAKVHDTSGDASRESEYEAVNVGGTRALLKAASAAGVQRFVFFSSVKAMGEGGEECLDESCQSPPKTAYGRSKKEAEGLVLNGGYVPEPCVLRLTMVYGLCEKGNLTRMIQSVAKNRFPPLPETHNKRSMVHVEDVVEAAILAAGRNEAISQTYIVTGGHPVSTRQLYEWICEALKKPVPSWYMPSGLIRKIAKAGDVLGRVRGRPFLLNSDVLQKLLGSACYSSAKIEGELGYRPRRNIHEALPEIVAWVQKTA